MSNSTIPEIVEKYISGQLTADETIVLDEWLQTVTPEEFHQVLDQCAALPAQLQEHHTIPERFARELESRLDQQDQHKTPIIAWKKWTAIAAALILLFSGGTLLWVSHHTQHDVAQTWANDIAPGGDGAILTLANGHRIVLDSARNGELATQGNTTITKMDSGKLAYNAPATANKEVLYNTLTTPRGKKIAILLPDGTAVWLNAASSIRFPTAFTGKDRTVEINGEAYFEVAKNAAQPFVVKKMGGDLSILVLGTSFNVNAYEDEDVIRTTLISGRVNVRKGDATSMLNPGQQAIVQKGSSQLQVVDNADLAATLAWKNGQFIFDRADIKSVMRQLARWYDVDIYYEGAISEHFGGTISREVNVSKVLQMLELTGAVRFKIEGRKLVVMP